MSVCPKGERHKRKTDGFPAVRALESFDCRRPSLSGLTLSGIRAIKLRLRDVLQLDVPRHDLAVTELADHLEHWGLQEATEITTTSKTTEPIA